MDFGIAAFLYSMFLRIYELGDQIIIIRLPGHINISVNNFFLVLAVMSIVLGALLNFARVHGDVSTRMIGNSAKTVYGRIKSRNERLKNSVDTTV